MNILPIVETPILNSYHNTAFSLSVLQSDYCKYSLDYIFDKAMNIRTKHDFNEDKFLDFTSKFFLYWNCFRFYPIEPSKKNFLAILKKCINQGFYIYLEINEMYIPKRDAYLNYEYIHDLLIYGYDENGYYSIAYNNDWRYSTQIIAYKNLKDAYFDKSNKKPFKILIFKPKKCYKINNKLALKKFIKYFEAKSSNTGIQVNQQMFEYMHLKMSINSIIDIRYFKVYKEHKMILFEYASAFYNNDKIIEILKQNYEISKKIFNCAIKYNLTKEDNIGNKIKYDFLKIYKNELKIREELLC